MSLARPCILGVCGTSTTDSRTRAVLDLALAAASASGAEVRMLDLSQSILPVMIEGNRFQSASPEVQLVRESAAWAEGFLLASPEYHGSMSGALKNWFDFLWRELAGKLAGVLVVTSSGHADNAVHGIKNCFHWCRGWTLPFHAAAVSADFVGDSLKNDHVRDRIARVGHDVTRYAPALKAAYDSAREAGADPRSGFAGLI